MRFAILVSSLLVAATVLASPSFARHVTLKETVKVEDRSFKKSADEHQDQAGQEESSQVDDAADADDDSFDPEWMEDQAEQEESLQGEDAVDVDDDSIGPEWMEIISGKPAVSASKVRKSTIHRARAQHKCPHCDYTTGYSGHLGNHLRAQHEGVTHKCPDCDYTTGYPADLRKHVRTKHEGVTHKCPDCEYTTGYPAELRKHVRIKHEGVREKCPHCDYASGDPSNLKRHVQAKHKGGLKRRVVDVDRDDLSEYRPAKRVRLDEPVEVESLAEQTAPVKVEDAPSLVVSDADIAHEIELLTFDMDPDESYENGLWLCEGIARFLIPGESVGPMPITQAPESRFREEVEIVKHPVPVKTEDDGVTQTRRISWQQSTVAVISSDRSKLSGFLPHPTIGFTESSGGELEPVIDLATKKHRPHHVHVNELDEFIARQVQDVDRPVIGTVTMSRVNEHIEGFTHIVTFYAHRNAAGEVVLKYIDPQDRDRPITTSLTETNTFLLKPRQKIDGDTFAPIVDISILRR